MLIDEETYLAHYGILGMKWGVRRDLRRKEKAAKYYKKAAALDTKISDLTREIDSIGGFSLKRGRLVTKRREAREDQAQALVDARLKEQGKLSTNQKKVLIGASVTAAIIGTTAAYLALQSGQARRLITMGKNALTGKDSEAANWRKRDILSKPDMDADSLQRIVASRINPNYGELGTKMNCRRATFAYEMRRRGYDVMATRTTSGRGQELGGIYNAVNPGVNIVPSGAAGVLTRLGLEARRQSISGTNSVKDTPFTNLSTVFSKGLGLNPVSDDDNGSTAGGIFKALRDQPDRSRGEVGVSFIGGGLHSIAYEIVNGKPVIFDTQAGKRFTTAAQMEKFYQNSLFNAGFTRLDNLPMNYNFLLRWLRNAES